MRHPDALMTTERLAALLGDPALRVFDCTVHLLPPAPGADGPYTALPGFDSFAEGHVPGADFLDLQGEFSRQDTPLRFMMAPVAHAAAAFGRHGVGPGAKVVLYSIGSMMWSTRCWWMLRSLGFDAAVLDGGFDRWKAEGRPIETGPARGYPPAAFEARPREGMFVDRDAVLGAIGRADTAIVNALSPDLHAGRGPSRYGRPGRVPSSVNVPYATLTPGGAMTTPEAAAAAFAAAGVTPGKRVICYCGGGISATIDLFWLWQLGYPDITLYDGSMGEWAKDPALPIETG
jgi:thiosulfate/3-mercaptopyruvate sulfurtransferase